MSHIREDGVRLIRARFATYHGFPQGNGSYIPCSRNASTCVLCRTEGVPLAEPDYFEVTRAYMAKYWNERWYSSYRTPRTDGEDMMDGIAIYVRVDGKTIVLMNMGDHPELEMNTGAWVYEHNRSIGME